MQIHGMKTYTLLHDVSTLVNFDVHQQITRLDKSVKLTFFRIDLFWKYNEQYLERKVKIREPIVFETLNVYLGWTWSLFHILVMSRKPLCMFED